MDPACDRVPPFPLPAGAEDPEALLLYENPQDPEDNIRVSAQLNAHLRKYQRQGVAFMFERCYGENVQGHQGAILADDMGLGKTVQVRRVTH